MLDSKFLKKIKLFLKKRVPNAAKWSQAFRKPSGSIFLGSPKNWVARSGLRDPVCKGTSQSTLYLMVLFCELNKTLRAESLLPSDISLKEMQVWATILQVCSEMRTVFLKSRFIQIQSVPFSFNWWNCSWRWNSMWHTHSWRPNRNQSYG